MRRSFTPKDFKLLVKRSRAGRGMFAGEMIPKGSCIIEYTGKPTSVEQMRANSGKYLFWTGRSSMIDGNIPGNRARFINHSCAPNCEVELKKRRIYIFAKRRIREGEELTYDYDTEYFDEHIKPRGCLCDKCLAKKSL
ncbi:SET domain-containing protein-lysine N-methyltransferase [Candidatus Kaiserbacteria bacterium]|nr:SET domain-containing protein-lysine N-methyltransferase [Candidatus Kaiserbacteria bacterium]